MGLRSELLQLRYYQEGSGPGADEHTERKPMLRELQRKPELSNLVPLDQASPEARSVMILLLLF